LTKKKRTGAVTVKCLALRHNSGWVAPKLGETKWAIAFKKKKCFHALNQGAIKVLGSGLLTWQGFKNGDCLKR
jgi:hypothetical protein